MENQRPCCVILNKSELAPEDLIQNRLFKGEQVSVTDQNGSKAQFRWNICSKYYTADVDLVICDPTTDQQPSQTQAEAMVIYVKEFASQDLESLRQFQKSFTTCDTQVLIIEERKPNDVDSDNDLTTWCIEEGIELIDFTEDIWDDVEEGSTFFASTPEKRVLEALQSCSWSNMKMKTKGKPEQEGKEAVANSDSQQRPEADGNVTRSLPTTATKTEAGGKDGNNDDGGEDEEDFEALFAKFASFRDQAGAMKSDESRREFAEKVTLSFWKALGGDPAELDDSD